MDEKAKSSEPREQICREDEARLHRVKERPGDDQGIRRDQRGQEQPADKKRAQKNK